MARKRAVANNGGDIAVRLADGQNLKLGVVYDLAAGTVSRTVCLTNRSGVGGVATSGLGGRSLTTGIASGVTVFSARCGRGGRAGDSVGGSFLSRPAGRSYSFGGGA